MYMTTENFKEFKNKISLVFSLRQVKKNSFFVSCECYDILKLFLSS